MNIAKKAKAQREKEKLERREQNMYTTLELVLPKRVVRLIGMLAAKRGVPDNVIIYEAIVEKLSQSFVGDGVASNTYRKMKARKEEREEKQAELNKYWEVELKTKD